MLHQYHIDFSQLSPDEKAALSDRIDNISFTGIQCEQVYQSCTIFKEEKIEIGFLKIPDCCHLSRIM